MFSPNGKNYGILDAWTHGQGILGGNTNSPSMCPSGWHGFDPGQLPFFFFFFIGGIFFIGGYVARVE